MSSLTGSPTSTVDHSSIGNSRASSKTLSDDIFLSQKRKQSLLDQSSSIQRNLFDSDDDSDSSRSDSSQLSSSGTKVARTSKNQTPSQQSHSRISQPTKMAIERKTPIKVRIFCDKKKKELSQAPLFMSKKKRFLESGTYFDLGLCFGQFTSDELHELILQKKILSLGMNFFDTRSLGCVIFGPKDPTIAEPFRKKDNFNYFYRSSDNNFISDEKFNQDVFQSSTKTENELRLDLYIQCCKAGLKEIRSLQQNDDDDESEKATTKIVRKKAKACSKKHTSLNIALLGPVYKDKGRDGSMEYRLVDKNQKDPDILQLHPIPGKNGFKLIDVWQQIVLKALQSKYYADENGEFIVGKHSYLCLRQQKSACKVCRIENTTNMWDLFEMKRKKPSSKTIDIELCLATFDEKSDDRASKEWVIEVDKEIVDQGGDSLTYEHTFQWSSPHKFERSDIATVRTSAKTRAAICSNTTKLRDWLYKVIIDEASPCRYAFTKEHFSIIFCGFQHKRYGTEKKHCWEHWTLDDSIESSWPSIEEFGDLECFKKHCGDKLPGKGLYPPVEISNNGIPKLPSFPPIESDTSESNKENNILAAAHRDGLKILSDAINRKNARSTSTVFRLTRPDVEINERTINLFMYNLFDGDKPKTFHNILLDVNFN